MINDDIKYECHIAALRAIDKVLNRHLKRRRYWITDAELPELLPHIDHAIDAAAARPDPRDGVRR